MKTKSSGKTSIKQRLFKYKSLFVRTKTKQKSWRAKHYKLQVTASRALLVTVRRFKTSPNNRSKKFKQTVLPVNILGVKELVIRQKVSKRKLKNQANKGLLTPSYSKAFATAGLVGMLFFTVQIVDIAYTVPPVVHAEQAPIAPLVEAEPQFMPESTPSRLVIPSIGVDSSINSMGQLADGTIETPGIFDDVVGWYQHSPTPGEVGPSVLLGHVDNYKGPSVFWRLGEIAVGSEVQVPRGDKTVAVFTVTAVEQYSQADFPTEKVYGNTDGSELRLITCGGSFNYLSLRYSKNTVVYAHLNT